MLLKQLSRVDARMAFARRRRTAAFDCFLNPMDPIEEVVNDLSKECFEDYVGLWTVPWHFQNVYHIDDEHLRREQSLKVIERLLAMPNIGVGQFLSNEEVFEFWDVPASDAIKRIAREWDTLGHEPNLG